MKLTQIHTFEHTELVLDLEIHDNLVIVASHRNDGRTGIDDVVENFAAVICIQLDIDPTELIWIDKSETAHYRLAFFNFTELYDPLDPDDIPGDFELWSPRWVAIDQTVVDAFIELCRVEYP